MEENMQNAGKSWRPKGKMLFLVGVLSFLILGWLFLTLVDMAGLGAPSIFLNRAITVTGSANRQQANQMAGFNATVSSKNSDKAKAVSEATQKSEKLVADLKQFGILDKDLKTQSLNIYRDQSPYWEDGVQKYRDGDWHASISIDITLRDISRSGDLTELLAEADTSNIWGPNYSLSEDEPEKAALLKQAFDNAKAKADSLADGMGLKVGKVLTVVEGSGYNNVYPMREMGMGGGGSGLEAGSTNVYTSLTVTFELR